MYSHVPSPFPTHFPLCSLPHCPACVLGRAVALVPAGLGYVFLQELRRPGRSSRVWGPSEAPAEEMPGTWCFCDEHG